MSISSRSSPWRLRNLLSSWPSTARLHVVRHPQGARPLSLHRQGLLPPPPPHTPTPAAPRSTPTANGGRRPRKGGVGVVAPPAVVLSVGVAARRGRRSTTPGPVPSTSVHYRVEIVVGV
jgi:hypothetical protein